MSKSFSFSAFLRRLALSALAAAAVASPAGAACPPNSRTVIVEPGRSEILIPKANLLVGLNGWEISDFEPPAHGSLEEWWNGHYLYVPGPSFWTAGFDSFLLRLRSTDRERGNRTESVLLLPALRVVSRLRQDFEGDLSPWVTAGEVDNLEVFSEGALSGQHSLRVRGVPGESSWLTAHLPLHGGGQQGSGAQATLRPPGSGGPGGLSDPISDPGNPTRVTVLAFGPGTSSAHRVFLRDDGEGLELQLATPTGDTPWVRISRSPHRIQAIQWASSDSDESVSSGDDKGAGFDGTRHAGASLWIDGALAAGLEGSSGAGMDPAAELVAWERLAAGVVEIVGVSSLALELDDLAFFHFEMAAGSTTCQVADGFDAGQPDPAWVNGSSFAVTAAAALQGEGGLAVPLGSSFAASMLRAPLPALGGRLGVRFRFDPNGVPLAAGSRVQLLRTVTAAGSNVFSVVLAPAASGYLLSLEDPTGTFSGTPPPVPIGDLPQEITLDWQRSASSNVALGTLRLWIDGEPRAEMTGLANASVEIAEVQLGALVSSTDRGGDVAMPLGTVYFDGVAVVRGPQP